MKPKKPSPSAVRAIAAYHLMEKAKELLAPEQESTTMKSSIRITNGGNTIHATGPAAAALFAALTEPIKQQAKHSHVNNGVDETCKECGKDLRDEIHLRVGWETKP